MYIVFDIGGTKMRLALSRDGVVFEEPRMLDTPQDFDAAVKLFGETARALLEGGGLEGAAGGVPGMLSPDRRELVHAPHLSAWDGKPLAESLEAELGREVYLENDAALVGLGEAHDGAGKGFSIVEYLTISTGVGGVRIENGHIDAASVGFEPGHQVIDIDHTLFPEASGTLESYVSGTAVQKRTGKHPREVTDEKFWDDIARYLAVGVLNTIVHWSPNVIVLGGSMMIRKPGIDIKAVERYLKEVGKEYSNLPPLRLAELRDFGGLYGALEYLKQKRQ
jgi:glucokinase